MSMFISAVSLVEIVRLMSGLGELKELLKDIKGCLFELRLFSRDQNVELMGWLSSMHQCLSQANPY